MWSFRFANQTQKDVHLTILRDLLVDNKDDQLAKTALSNAIAISEATMVAGELDEMIARTNRMHWQGTVGASVFFIALALAELVWGYFVGGWASYVYAAGIVFFAFALHFNYRLQQRYHTALKWLADQQLELPRTPVSLHKVRN